MKKAIFNTRLFRLALFGLVAVSLAFASSCKKEDDPGNDDDNGGNSGNNTKKESTIVIFAKPNYCDDYIGEITVKVDGEVKGTITTCHEDRSCGESGAITVTVTDGEHKLEASSSSYSNSLTTTLNQQQCYKWALD